MFKPRNLFGGFMKPKNPHSLDHLKYLYSVLSKNQTVTDGNRSLLVETLRSIAEILIWGDQNDSSVFDFFLERNMLSFFLKIMNQKCGSYVCVQLLQTLNILFENIRNETSIYYLLSNNHVNAIIVHKFDFSDEEVMAYYISFLKTLSFRLNKHTIHFFYNEHTNDFPLYTEAIKFFNHSESMVRIAVRTLTLNVYRTEEESMLKFVIDKTAVPYFSNLVWFIGNHILDMDACVREDTDHRSLGRLKDLAAEHLDHLHYLNDILCLHIEPLNAVLTDHLLKRLLIPLYIFSLGRRSQKDGNKKSEDMKPHVSRISALFLLCQIFLIVTHKPLVRVLAWIIFCGNTDIFTEKGAAKVSLYSQGKSVLMKPRFAAPHVTLEKSLKEEIEREEADDDESATSGSLYEDSLGLPDLPVPTMTWQENPHNLSITDEEKEKRLQESGQIGGSAGENVSEGPEIADGQTGGDTRQDFSLENRPFLEGIFQVMSCEENDYMALFGLCLLYAIQQNAGIGSELLEGVFIPSPQGESKGFYNVKLMEKLLHILLASCQYGSKIRLITLEIATMLIKSLVINPEGRSFLSDTHFAQIEGIREESTLLLRNYYKSEEIFLDMFEDEYRAVIQPPTRIDYVMSDACLLLPPTGTPLSGIDFTKRLPCGEVERARRSIRTFFFLRRLSLQVQGLREDKLPLSNTDSLIQVQDVLDLNNSDLVAVNVTNRDNTKQRRYLVVDVYQIILVEPDFSRLGWGVATFAGFLQDLDVLTDKDDSRCLHVTVHRPGGSGISAGSRLPLLSASFTFDDHIRCMAARQRLTKGRTKARQRKMHQIAQLLELPGNVGPSCPSPPSLNLHSLRKEAAAQRVNEPSRTRSSSRPRKSSSREGPGLGPGLGAVPRETSRRSHPSRRSSSSATSCRESNCHHEKESVALTEYRTSTTNRGNAPTQASSPRGDGSPHSTLLSTPKKPISGQEHTNL
ncbi:protein CLEC16A homolog isoform X2 [Tigriopus californicus]|uniref:protein CLEC16A homolog isoform X2 n=1 Tax=Tigriopus californicus TaxID=6832 RepID=UPI0027D9E0A6|nr:protein CLEC16A homolog isoform X2 [Tigriopus californicus]